MSKLGVKVIITYIIIAIITTAMFALIIQNSIMNIIINEKTSNIKNMSKLTASTIKYLIDKSGIDKGELKSKDIRFVMDPEDHTDIYIQDKIISVHIEKTKDVDTYVLDINDTIVYSTTKNLDVSKKDIISDDKVFYYTEKVYIYNKFICSVLAVTKKEYYVNLNSYINNEIYRVFLLTLMFALIIALIFEKKIVAPISAIRKNISNISLEGKLDWNKINTDDELEDINKELYEITKELRSSNKMQKEFFQNTSHELKTPLMSIRGYAEAIKDDILDYDESQNALDIIIDESNKLSNTINSFLYLEKIEKYTRRLEDMEKINIYREIEEFIEIIGAKILEKEIEIVNNIPENIYVSADKEKIHRIISNLLSNAIRYTNKKIMLNSKIENGKLHFLVEDDGKGFNINDIDRVFERFYKGEKGNSGLGLSIVNSIVKSFNGEVKAYNSNKGGAVIEIVVDIDDDIILS